MLDQLSTAAGVRPADADERAIARPHLERLLDAGLRVTLISAPAGAGKTTLARAWAARARAPVVWCEADRADPESAVRWLGVAAAGGALGGVELAVVVDELSPALGPAAAAELAALIEGSPAATRWVLIGRGDPPLPLARWRARGELAELRGDQLRFSAAEAREMLARLGAPLSDAQAARLNDRAEGWAAGLFLASIALRREPDPERVVGGLRGGDRFIRDYLDAEVFSREPPEVRQFLLATAVLPTLDVAACAELLDPPEDGGEPPAARARRMLDELERRALFVTPLDRGRQSYRYQRLFGEFLRDTLAERAPEQAAEVRRRAARHAASRGDWRGAVGHAFDARDDELAAELIEGGAREMIEWHDLGQLRDWVARLPEPLVRRRQGLWAVAGLVALFEGRLAVARAWLERARDAADQEPCHPLAGKREVVGALLLVIDAASAPVSDADLLAALPDGEAELRLVVAMIRGAQHLHNAEFARAAALLDGALQAGDSAPAPLAVRAQITMARAALAEGRLREARRRYGAAARALSLAGRTETPLAAAVALGLGAVACEQGQLEEAEAHALRGVELARRGGAETQAEGWLVLGRIQASLGQPEAAAESMARAQSLAAGIPSGEHLGVWALAEQALLAARAGDLPRAHGLLVQIQAQQLPGRLGDIGLSAVRLLEVGVLRLLGFTEDARRLVEGAGIGEGDLPLRAAIELWLQRALLRWQLGDGERAAEALARAVELAEPESYLRPFAEEAGAVAALLRSAAAQARLRELAAPPSPIFLGMLGRSAEPAAPTRLALPPAEAPQGVDALTARELEVLRLLAGGMSNREVAAALVVSVATVKTHLIHIYAKLQAANRTAAVARARALGLV